MSRRSVLSRTIVGSLLCSLLPRAAAAQPPPGADVRPLYRYYSPSVVDHFYTASFTERGCGSGGYAYEGVIGYILQSQALGSVPLFRYFNASVQDHFYTSSATELLPGYVAEGTTGYVFTQQLAGTVPIFRFYDSHPNVTDHLYTTNPAETFPPGTYVFEGIPGYVYQGPALGAVPCVSTGSISQPLNNAAFELVDDTFRSTTVSLAGRVPGALVNWKIDLTYTTSGGVGPFVATRTTSSVGYDVPAQQTLTGIGGQATVTAGCEVCGSLTRTVTVAGPSSGIPDDQITAQLVNVYATGATPHLLTGIAAIESTYTQFFTRTLFGASAKWPTENFPTRHVPAGTHIGLMQVVLAVNGIGAAFDWVENTVDGAALFRDKLATALRYETRIRARHKGLRALTGVERENMAVLLYGPGASTNLQHQYYVQSCVGGRGGNCNGGTWTWLVNTQNTTGVNYVNDVRASIR